MFMSPQTTVASGPAATDLTQRGQPRELVVVVLGVGLAPVRHVHRRDSDPSAGRGHRARLGLRKAGRAVDARDHVLEADARQDRDPVPRRFAVGGERIAAVGELLAEQLGEAPRR